MFVRSEARRRKRAVFWRAGKGVVAFVVVRWVFSQVWVGGRALVCRWVVRRVAREGEGVVVDVAVVDVGGAGAGGWRWLAIFFCLIVVVREFLLSSVPSQVDAVDLVGFYRWF